MLFARPGSRLLGLTALVLAGCAHAGTPASERAIPPSVFVTDPQKYAGQPVRFLCRVVSQRSKLADALCSSRNDALASPVLLRGDNVAQLVSRDVIVTGVAAFIVTQGAFGERLFPVVDIESAQTLESPSRV